MPCELRLAVATAKEGRRQSSGIAAESSACSSRLTRCQMQLKLEFDTVSRAEATRGRILTAARALLEARPGVHLSMSDIAGAADVTRQLLYFHFENRTALLLELSRLIDAEARTPTLQATIDDAPDARAALRAAVRVQAAIKPKIHG